jgi:heat shock protein HslJ
MSEFSRIDDHGDDRGLCKGCRFWEAEHEGSRAEDAAVGICLHPELTHVSLQVSGHSGCNRFAPVYAAAGAP